MATNINKIAAFFDATMNDVLRKSAEAIANDAKSRAPTERIKANINVSEVRDTSNGKEISVYVDISPNGTPEGRAYELGSGIHGQFKSTYPINAKNVPNLVFFWEKKNKWFVGPHVDHPGVAARPYLAPAVDKNKKTLLGLLSKGISKIVNTAIITGFKE